uniref:NACHT domain-containing protein n=1 Tax=Otolemur garnettii TaxID=30611 RepID=H0XV61_OTOGA
QQDHFINMEHVFDPDEAGFSLSRTVVLQGCAGIGKTALVHKFMFDWAAGIVSPGRFDYLIYINCREISHIASLSAADLITNTFQDVRGPILDIVLIYPEKLLFILDGFPELQHPMGDQEEALSVQPQERKPVESLLCSFVRKKLLPESSLLITARPTAMKKLHSLLRQPIQAEILWFTSAEKRAYFLSQFSGVKTAMKLFYGLRENEGLDVMSSLPIVSWMICSVLKSQGDGDRPLLRSLQTMTDVYLFYFSKCLRTLTDVGVWKGQNCLWGLCCLAAEALQSRQVLFAASDLRRHGIGVCDSSYTFLSHFLKKADDINAYTFLHFSFQEFLTAVFYVLKNDNKWMYLSQVGKAWHEIFQRYGKGFSSLTIRFLFGLLRKGKGKIMETTFGRKISPGLREELLKWTEREIKDKSSRLQIEPVDLFHCLYEIREEEYSRRIMDDLHQVFSYSSISTVDNSVEVECSRHCCLAGLKKLCLKDKYIVFPVTSAHYKCFFFFLMYLESACLFIITSEWLTELEFNETKLEVSALTLLCEGLKDPNCRLQKLNFLPENSEAVCKCLASVVICNPNLTELDLSENPLGDIGVKYLCEGLKHSDCKVEKLDLSTCCLTDASCVELSSCLQVSQTLKELFVFANAVGDTGVQHLCKGLQHPKCAIENLVLSECSLSAACCQPLGQVLRASQSLTRLLLINNKIEDLGLKLLCEGLKQPDCQLKDLALWTCHLTPACCKDLCNALYTNENLRVLDLSDNALGDEGMRVLCEGLKHPCCRLQTLWLAECHLTDACCGALASVLNRNENLTLLDLTGNDLRDFGVQMLCDALIHPICKLQ